MIVFLNGHFVPEAGALVPVNDRGFMYGDGLFETIRIVNGRPFRMAQHLERLTRGAAFLKIQPPFTPAQMEQFAGELIAQNQLTEAVLRVTLTRGPGGRGYTPGPAGQPTTVMTLHPTPPLEPPVEWSLITSSFRIPAADPLAPFKTSSRIVNVMARVEAAEKGADEALLLNTKGEVAEAASGNLFWIDDDQIGTVPTDQGVLPGITRALVLEICQGLGLRTSQRAIQPGELRHARGIFVTQSVFGIVPVVLLDGAPVPRSPRVDQIAAAYNEMLRRA